MDHFTDEPSSSLVVLAAQHEHGRVHHLDELRDVEPPQHRRDPEGVRVVAVVHGSAPVSKSMSVVNGSVLVLILEGYIKVRIRTMKFDLETCLTD